MSNKQALGDQLKELRNKMEMTQDDVVARSGLGRNQVIAIEKGTGNPTLETLFKYLDAIGARLNAQLQW